MRTRLTAISFGLTIAAAIFLLTWPVYSGVGTDGPKHATLVEVNGSWVIAPVLFPALLTLGALVIRTQAVRIAVTIVMGGFALVSGFSIGLFYVPAAVVMMMAACVEDSARARDV